jgi:hypothetical protein
MNTAKTLQILERAPALMQEVHWSDETRRLPRAPSRGLISTYERPEAGHSRRLPHLAGGQISVPAQLRWTPGFIARQERHGNGFVTNVATSELNHLNGPFMPSVTTTPLWKSAAMTRPLANILETLLSSIVSSISLIF